MKAARTGRSVVALGIFALSCAGPRPEFGRPTSNDSADAGHSGSADTASDTPTADGTSMTTVDDGGVTDTSDTVPTEDTQQGGATDEDSGTSNDTSTTDTSTEGTTEESTEGTSSGDGGASGDTSVSTGQTSAPECVGGEKRTCAEAYGSVGVCGTVELTCTEDGTWPSDSSCSAAATSEVCAGELDEDCDGEVNEAAECPCASHPCENGGTCEADGASYACDCTGTGFAGKDCSEPVAVVLPPGPGDSTCTAVSVSNDATTVGATCNSRPAYWSQSNGWQYLQLPLYSAGTLVDMTSDGQTFLATLTADDVYETARWSSRTATGTILTGFDGNASAAALSGNGQSALGSGFDGTLLLWSGTSDVKPLLVPDGSGGGKAVNQDGTVIWCDSANGLVRWDELPPIRWTTSLCCLS